MLDDTDELAFALGSHKAERSFEHFVYAEAGEFALRWRGKLQHAADNGTDSAHFRSHDPSQLGILVPLQQQIDEGFHRYERILYLVGTGSGQSSQGGQAIQVP